MKTLLEWIHETAVMDIGSSVGIGKPPAPPKDGHDGNGGYNPKWPNNWNAIRQWFLRRSDEIIPPVLEFMVNQALGKNPDTNTVFKGNREGGLLARVRFSWITNRAEGENEIDTAKGKLEHIIAYSSIREVLGGSADLASELMHGLLDALWKEMGQMLAKKCNQYSGDPLHVKLNDLVITAFQRKDLFELAGQLAAMKAGHPGTLSPLEGKDGKFESFYYNLGNGGYVFEVERLCVFK
jgi:hypothetical protein